MPLIWCAISGHGYGHAAQMIPVLNELGRARSGLKALLRTSVPASFFEGGLTIEWELSPAEPDIGCVQRGPLTIDIGATWREHARFHADWSARVEEEARAIRARAPALVVANIPPLSVAAAARAGVPAVGLCNLSWDAVLEPFLDEPRELHPGVDRPTRLAILAQMREAYGRADLMILPTPAVPVRAFRRIAQVGPIAPPRRPNRTHLREVIGAQTDERVVLVAFGGIPLETLPTSALEAMEGYRFIVVGPVPPEAQRTHRMATTGLPFGLIMTSADLLVTKPGYSTIVEAVAHGLRVLYVRRYNFVDEPPLVDYLHRYGRGVELSAEDFASGRWRAGLDALWALPEPEEPAPAPTGATEAARLLAGYL
ncbi:hypothetical protein [Nitrospira sp. Kam-Ns4a]